MWTHFWDMHSGGSQKTQWGHIYIEADEEEAELIFYNRFGRNPEDVACACCGGNYSISSEETLEELTGYQRGCDWEEVELDRWQFVERPSQTSSYPPYQTLEQFLADEDVLVVPASEIKAEERMGTLPDPYYPEYDYDE